MGRIGRLNGTTKVRQYPFDDGRILNARDHLELPAAAPAGLDVDGKHPLEALHPTHGGGPVQHCVIVKMVFGPPANLIRRLFGLLGFPWTYRNSSMDSSNLARDFA